MLETHPEGRTGRILAAASRPIRAICESSSRSRSFPAPRHLEVGLDAPPSVREAIRLADGLLPASPALPLRDPPAGRRRAVLVVVPVLAIAAAGAFVAYTHAVRRAAVTASPSGGEACLTRR